MSEEVKVNVRAKLGLDVFKESGEFHIAVREGRERDPRLARAVRVCPAGLYSRGEDGVVEVSEDGCLECGTCLVALGPELLSWHYPDGEAGVQYRFG